MPEFLLIPIYINLGNGCFVYQTSSLSFTLFNRNKASFMLASEILVHKDGG